MKHKPVTYATILDWADENGARITQAGHFPAQVLYIAPENLKALCNYLNLPRMGKVSGGRCYKYQGEDFFMVVICIEPTSGQAVCSIAHECYHAVNFMYAKYGARHSLKNDEPTAYLISHLAFYASKFLEEQGYGFVKLHDANNTGSGAHSEDLRDELRGDTSGRDGTRTGPLAGDDDPCAAALLPCGCAGRCVGHPVGDVPRGGLHYVIDEATIPEPCEATAPEPMTAALPITTCTRCGREHGVDYPHTCHKRDVLKYKEANREQKA